MLHRLMMLCIGACLGLVLAQPAAAQRQTLTDAPLLGGGDRITVAALATSPLTRAEMETWWKKLSALAGRGQVLPPELVPPDQPGAWTTVNLPDLGRGRQRAVDEPPLEMRWYHIHYTPQSAAQAEELGIYLPRLRSLAVTVLLRTEAGWLPVLDNQADAREQWARPVFRMFPPFVAEQLQRDGAIELVVAAPVLKSATFMVPSVRLGSEAELAPIYRLRWMVQIGLPQSLTLLLLVLAAFSFSVWIRQRDETVYLYATVASLLWVLRNLHYHIQLPDGPMAYNWFWWVTHASMGWVMVASFQMVMRFVHERHERFERLLMLFAVACSVLTMPLWRLPVNPVLAQHLANGVVALAATIYITAVARRGSERDRDLRLITTGLWLGLVPAVHDIGILAGWGWQEQPWLMPLTTLIIVVAFLIALKYRFDDAREAAAAANRQLGERLAEQGAQLQAQHDQLSEAERQQALLLERQRLMQDMHDGLGSSLLSAMVAVEQGRMSQEQVVEVLRECVDDLRLVIDSLEPVGHDLVSLLATMRYRLGKRLQTGGLMLEWDVQDLPPLPWLEPPDALHVLRLLQEALNNALKHAQATRVRIATRDLGSKVEIRVEDDGLGFDLATVPKGRGLRSQIKRAKRLGGVLQLDTRQGQGTRLSLVLPVNRPAPPQPGHPPAPAEAAG